MVILEILAATLPLGVPMEPVGPAASAWSLTTMLVAGGTAIGSLAVVAGVVIKVFGNGTSTKKSEPVAAPASHQDPVLDARLMQIGTDITEIKAEQKDSRDRDESTARDVGRLEGKLDTIITLLKPSGIA